MNSTISIENAIAEAGTSFSGGYTKQNTPQAGPEFLGSGVTSSFEQTPASEVMPGVDTSSARPYLGGPSNDRPGYVSE